MFTAGQEKENQERNKDPGKSEGWPKYHLTVRYCQGSCGNFVFLVVLPFNNSAFIYMYKFLCITTHAFFSFLFSHELLLWSLNM